MRTVIFLLCYLGLGPFRRPERIYNVLSMMLVKENEIVARIWASGFWNHDKNDIFGCLILFLVSF